MWNYRVVRKKHVNIKPDDNAEEISYTYGIHEAYYEKGYVYLITEKPESPFGEDIEELRHNWVMMAEAFAKPILDYDEIPEPGYVPEKAEKEEKTITHEELRKELYLPTCPSGKSA